MEQIVTVIALEPGNMALMEHQRPSACSGDCHQCAGCGAVKQTMHLRAYNAIGARVGDQVRLQSRSASVLKAVFVVYLMPIVLFFLGYGLGTVIHVSPALAGGCAFALALGISIAYNRYVTRSGEMTYTMVGYAAEQNKENVEC